MHENPVGREWCIYAGCFTILSYFKNFIKQKVIDINDKLKAVRFKTP